MSDTTPYIYADNAATTPLSPRALEAMTPYLTRSFGNPSGIHRMAREAAVALNEARRTMAHLLGAEHAGEIYFTSGGSESDNWILRGAVRRFRDTYGERAVPHIVTSAIEHHAILHCCRALEAEGVRVTYLPVDAQGRIDPSELEHALAEHDRRETAADANVPVALVSIMLANNEIGTVEPIRELAAIAHDHHAPFHTDAVQAVGHIPVDVRELGVDALSLSGHKFHGPHGVGALYLREGFSIPPLIAGGAQERGGRAGTEDLAGIVGMATALEEACEHLEDDMRRVSTLRDELVERILSSVDGVRLTGAPIRDAVGSAPANDTGHGPDRAGACISPAACVNNSASLVRLPSIASFTCDDVDGELLVVLLDRNGVAAATGSACSTGSAEPSHVLTAAGCDAATARGALRLSLARDITAEDIDRLCVRVPACINRARLISGMH